VSDSTSFQGWSELLLALPEFLVADARIDEHTERVAEGACRREKRRHVAAASTTTETTCPSTTRELGPALRRRLQQAR